LLDRLAGEWSGRRPVVFDEGRFRGDWSAAVLERAPHARVFTFEPNTRSFEGIRARFGDRVSAHHFAFGAEDGSASLSAPPGLPEMGSLHVRDLREVDLVVDEIEPVRVTSIDAFCAEHRVERIDLLKLDVEGHELLALQGAAGMLGRGAIDAVQFEFGGTNVDARVFLRDLVGALPGYRLFRIIRDGLDPLDRYDVRAEIFAFCNFLAVRKGPRPTDAPQRPPPAGGWR
ncbi:MAG: FkbM family methyltransferase, partial [Actinomycetota bacterium]|nr:FkbM family methyltransferase [Actinomycetota bacterium]